MTTIEPAIFHTVSAWSPSAAPRRSAGFMAAAAESISRRRLRESVEVLRPVRPLGALIRHLASIRILAMSLTWGDRG
jgi:hypothetical protein